MQEKIYLNFGAGNPVPKWVNLDSSPFFMIPAWLHLILYKSNLSTRSFDFIKSGYIYYKFSTNQELPFADNSVQAIHTSHVLEHLSLEENGHFFKEAHRVLIKGGVLRVIVPDLEKKLKFDQLMYSLEKDLLTLPQELKSNKIRAALEAIHGFPSFHKTLFVSKKIQAYFSKKWHVKTRLSYLESNIDKNFLKIVEQKARTKDALIFELTSR